MTIFQSILLGIIQGLTEFLPISSSAHLVLMPYLFNWQITIQDAFIFDVLVQLGTLLAVIAYFWKDLFQIIKLVISGLIQRKPFADPMARLGWFLVLATVPALIAGLFFKDLIEKAFASPLAAGLFLLGTTALLVTAELVGKRNRQLDNTTWLDALIIGLFQIISLFPGISRSGSTITGGMVRNLDRPAAARFSFLMSVPVFLGAGLLAVLDLLKLPNFSGQLPTLLAGFITAAVVGYLAIHWLLSFLAKRSLHIFAIYSFCVSLLVVIVYIIRL
ncbi:MAG: undecaprenyl-diphosphatase UppP [Anaerolineales bacterium]|nr:MAG: undecaprenyl-diphosphatase UppP [Anaerolineales bacterium]